MISPVRLRALSAVAFDLIAVVLAWLGAYLLRFNFEWPSDQNTPILVGLLILLVIQLIVCRYAGLYRGIWIFASLPDLKRVIKAVLVPTVVLLLTTVFSPTEQHLVPRSVIFLYPILLLLIMGGGRVAWRMYREASMERKAGEGSGKPVVIVGAGAAGALMVKELQRSNEWNVVALVDDNPAMHGKELHGYLVEGATENLPEILARYDARHVIIAIPTANREAFQHITQTATSARATVLTIPSLSELMSGRVAINSMRPVKVEDLLGREAVKIDDENVSTLLAGRRILVTGAGGSIGSELCRQLARFHPAQILLVEASEFALYTIEQWFRTHRSEIEIVPLAADIKDEVRMDQIFTEYKPEVVFHAAAYKHVPLMEQRNAWQAVRNNVFGTLTVARLAQTHGVKRFVLISTDKAVNPTNVMGATKRMAEMTCLDLQTCPDNQTIFQMVRFGNVLGSTGSVIPKFKQQIESGGPITVTHPDITRYFMSIPEAAQLVLQASAMGKGGEVFVLDMGEPVKITDMARNMIRLAGLTEEQIGIEFTGLRPGEKLYEELLADAEETLETTHPKLRIARARQTPATLFNFLLEWYEQHTPMSDDEVRATLKQWIPEYTPNNSI
ncbi:polysaccharide biosynthesis protein [Kerstersia similis]|uniref:polysaccharide biosynthesis protein n=1 Tax=Kerstersia similis TaxID=206505 RepID=UPI0039F11B2A